MHRISFARAQIHGNGLAFGKIFQPHNVSVGEIIDVDVVADAGTVGSGIVVAKDLQRRPLSLHRLENEWDQMSLGFVHFADGATFICAGGVEISEADVPHTISTAVCLERQFKRELGSAVRIYRLAGIVFGDRNLGRISIDQRRWKKK